MRVAMTVWGDRVSPVLDCARSLLVGVMAGSKVVDKAIEFVEAGYLPGMMRFIMKHGVQVLICGAVSQELANIIETCDVELIPFLAGDAETILETFARGQSISAFAMPGCRCAGGCRRRNDWSALKTSGNRSR
jgi:predicted Fe-Mo cluster-binding NifX family protein